MIQIIRASLKWKLVSLIMVIIVSMVSMIGFFSYYDTSRTIRQDVSHYSEQILRQANLNLNRQYLEYERGFLVLGTSNEFTEWLKVDPEDRFELISGFHSLERNYLRSFLVRQPEIMSISMLSDKGGEFNYALTSGLHKDYTMANEPWLNEVARLEKVHHRVVQSTAYVDYNNNPQQVLLLSMAGQFGDPDAKGFLKMDISLEPVQTILNQMELGDQGESLIVKPDGTILVHQNKSEVGRVLEPDIIEKLMAKSAGTYLRKETQQLIVFDTIAYTGWKTVAILSNQDLTSSINRVRNVTVGIASMGILIAITLVTLVAASITRRLSKLRSHMKRAQYGNFRDRLPIAGTDEVSDLSHSFNRMLDELEDSIQQLTESQVMQQRAAFSAMQSQIRSHFLYNSLESINSMAHLAGHTGIERASISLSRMLRYTSNYRDTLVKLEDEIAHVTHYMNISQIRFGDDVRCQIHIPDDCRDVLCLKVILQPIAENAIKHGIETTGEPTELEVTVQREGDMVAIIFEDNGKDYDEERMEAFRAKLHQVTPTQEEYAMFSNVGLLNVHFRLQAFFHMRGVGVDMDRGSHLGGVRVTVRIPYRLNNVQEKGAIT